MKKNIRFIVASVIALIFTRTFVFLWFKSRPQPEVYDEFTPKMSNLKKITVITGKIEPRNEVNVEPQISGIITEIMKETGEMVQAGEIVTKVKVVPNMNQLSNAQSHAHLAQINAKQAKVNYDRKEKLYDKGLVAGDEYDKIRQAHQQSQEEVKVIRDSLKVVRDGVSRSNANTGGTLIRSTISDLVPDVPAKVSNAVILSNIFNNGTTIATVANMGDLIFRGNIDETEAGQLSVDMPMKITIGALQDNTLQASLEYTSPKAVEQNGANQSEVKAVICSIQGKEVRSGYSANAEIVLANVQNVLTVPESAIEFSGKQIYVCVVKGDEGNKTYERRKVEIGMGDGLNIEIKSGLSKNEKVRRLKKVKEDQDDAIVLCRLVRTVLQRHSFVSDIEFYYKKPYKKRK